MNTYGRFPIAHRCGSCRRPNGTLRQEVHRPCFRHQCKLSGLCQSGNRTARSISRRTKLVHVSNPVHHRADGSGCQEADEKDTSGWQGILCQRATRALRQTGVPSSWRASARSTSMVRGNFKVLTLINSFHGHYRNHAEGHRSERFTTSSSVYRGL